jgi:pimeloyl-ACP methyl ester carboxylesterase
MSTFVLIPGAGGAAWYWHQVIPLLEEAGHKAIAVDLPADDGTASLEDYADQVVEATGKRRAILVAQSLGGFTAPVVCEHTRVEALVFVNAMIPMPGEKADDWGKNTGSGEARTAAARSGGYSATFDVQTYFFHDVPKKLVQEAESHDREQSDRVMGEPCPFRAWPSVPIRVIAGHDDRLFPFEFQRRVARERLGVDIQGLRGGHLVALSNPKGLAKLLLKATAVG